MTSAPNYSPAPSLIDWLNRGGLADVREGAEMFAAFADFGQMFGEPDRGDAEFAAMLHGRYLDLLAA
ncbi:hypothetical protein [Azospirillum tabaci]|uniref:hypothetical protein n=1 Tax=Azospirillum tabaci TaxID=2752310 RepID=UPI0016605973|nr:hypothetical protein [Azospirillum tabaci]